MSVTGVVDAIERPEYPACAPDAVGSLIGADEGQFYDLVIDDGEQKMRFVVRLPWSRPIVNVGDVVSVDVTVPSPGFGPNDAKLVIRDGNGELLLAIIDVNDGPSEIALPELLVADGDHTCTERDVCGMSTRGSLRVTHDGDEATIDYGARAEIGGYVVLNLDNTRHTAAMGACTDSWSYHRVVVAVVRGSEASLAEPSGDDDAGL